MASFDTAVGAKAGNNAHGDGVNDHNRHSLEHYHTVNLGYAGTGACIIHINGSTGCGDAIDWWAWDSNPELHDIHTTGVTDWNGSSSTTSDPPVLTPDAGGIAGHSMTDNRPRFVVVELLIRMA